jgi:hypothetical protein
MVCLVVDIYILLIDPFFKLFSIEKSTLDKTSIAQKVRAVTRFDSL